MKAAAPVEQPKVAAAIKVASAPVRETQPARDLPRLPKEDRPVKAARPALVDDDPTEKPDKPARPVKAAVEKSAAPEKSAGGEGYLRLGSKPWTNIGVDGKETGLHTPQTQLKLGAGSHRITLTNPQFNIKETFSVDIKPGETTTMIKDLRQQGADTD